VYLHPYAWNEAADRGELDVAGEKPSTVVHDSSGKTFRENGYVVPSATGTTGRTCPTDKLGETTRWAAARHLDRDHDYGSGP